MMNLSAAGLNATEAKMYQTLLSRPEWKPVSIAKVVGESRTNTYKILDTLTEMGLAQKYDKAKVIHYRANHPSRLIELAEERKAAARSAEAVLVASSQALLAEYLQVHEQPGIRYYTGKEGIEQIYRDQIKEAQPISMLITKEDRALYGYDFMHSIRSLAPDAGIPRRAFTPDVPEIPRNIADSDRRRMLERTWYLTSDYTAPVEWGVYGDKTSIISFGEEAIGMVIESPQIAESVRQIFKIMQEGLRNRPGYGVLPTRGKYSDAGELAATCEK